MKKFIQVIMILGVIVGIFLMIVAFKDNLFRDPHALKAFIEKLGPLGVFVFILLQVIQPIIPIAPGGLSDVAGVMMFGPVVGLFYVCLGLVIGETILFLLVRKYGLVFVEKILSEKNVERLNHLIEKGNGHMVSLLSIVFFMPFGPDDLACMAAGFSNMSLKKYVLTITLLKPFSVGIHVFLVMDVLKMVS